MPDLRVFRPIKNPPTINTEYLDRAAEVAEALEEHPYQFASTMPSIPHSYTLRRRWQSEKAFSKIITKMREVERVEENWRGWWRAAFMANGYKYWTMGANVDGTILVNRTHHRPNIDPYAAVCHLYDDALYPDKKSGEAAQSMYRAHKFPPNAVILDVGCGTGNLVDFRHRTMHSDRYVGLDASGSMLGVFADKHHSYRRRLVRSEFCDYYPKVRGAKYDLIVALCGSASYLGDPDEVKTRVDWLLRRGGQAIFQYYRDDASIDRVYRALGTARFGQYSPVISGDGWEEAQDGDLDWLTVHWRKP